MIYYFWKIATCEKKKNIEKKGVNLYFFSHKNLPSDHKHELKKNTVPDQSTTEVIADSI